MREWLLFFYTVPAKPVGSRMRVWRKLTRIGAVQLKGTVYLLPASDEHRELLQWLVGETVSAGGEAGFVLTERIDPYEDGELRELFNRQRTEEYAKVARELDSFSRRLASFRKGTRQMPLETLHKQFQKIRGGFQEIRGVDFFDSPAGRKLEARLAALEPEIQQMPGRDEKPFPGTSGTLRPADFQGRTWVTRPRPFVDRIASAWLIRRFIDPGAAFIFLSEDEIRAVKGDLLSFDVAGGDFTHHHDLCTFEALMERFGFSDPPLRQLAQVVHDLDLKDAKFGHPAAPGVEMVIAGIRARGESDQEILAQGMMVFEALYDTFSRGR